MSHIRPAVAGINLSELVDYRQQCPFRNEMRCSRIWREVDSTTLGQTSVRLISENAATGYPSQLAGNRAAETIFGTGLNYQAGDYAIAFEGDGEIGWNANSGANLIRTRQQYSEFVWSAGGDPVNVYIFQTNPANPVRNIWVGQTALYADRGTSTLKPDWAAMLTSVGTNALRFMDWQHTNGSVVTSWAGTKPAGYYTDSGYVFDDSNTGNGGTYSSMLNACIELGVSIAWFCIPAMADDLYVFELLRFIRDHRDQLNRAYAGFIFLELSNETWNGSFAQHVWMRDRGVALGLQGNSDYDRGHQFYALRSSQVFAAAASSAATLGLTGRIKTVLAGQATVGEYHFRFRTQIRPMDLVPTNVAADIWSVSSYFGNNAHDPNYNGYPEAQWLAATPAEIRDFLREDIDTRTFGPPVVGNDGSFPSNPVVYSGGLPKDVLIATARGMQVVCYEGGQHLVPDGGYAGPPPPPVRPAWGLASRQKILTMNRHSYMGELTEHAMNMVTEVGGLGTMYFDEGTGWHNDFGSWSWYEDPRNGYTDDAKFLAWARHVIGEGGGGGSIGRVEFVLPVVIARTSPLTAALSSVQLSAALSDARAIVRTSGLGWTFDIDPEFAQLSDAYAIASCGGMSAGLNLPPDLLAALLGTARAFYRLTGIAGLIIDAPNFMRNVGIARAYTRTSSISATLLSHTIVRLLGNARVIARTSGLGAPLGLRGQDGVQTRNIYRHIFRHRGRTNSAPVPHGTTVYVGQWIGWLFPGVMRPLRAGDKFAGICTEYASGWEVDEEGISRIRTEDYLCHVISSATMWGPVEGITGPADFGRKVYALDDTTLTLTPNGSDIGKVLGVIGLRALIYFEGIDMRVETQEPQPIGPPIAPPILPVL